jgi:hypothetical protein
MTEFRVDVLRFLPTRLDGSVKPDGTLDPKPTPKHVVNDADLIAHGLPLHKVSLPTRNGNQIPESAGASLVIVYVDKSEPLTKIVFYDGIHVQASLNDPMKQTLRGFYLSSSTRSAKITHIIASGQPNANERVFFNDGQPASSALPYDPTLGTKVSPPNPIAGGTSSQRAWTDLTYTVSGLMNPGNSSTGGYGETATTTVDHSGGGGYDCLTWGAVIFSTAVQDAETNGDGGALGDGLPDGLEEASGGLKDPDGQDLPDLKDMGASSGHRDLFIEVNAMWAEAGTSWGSATAPYDSARCTSTDTSGCKVTDPGFLTCPATDSLPADCVLRGHHHVPAPADLKLIGDRYAAHGITTHFDVGNIAAYHDLGVVYHADWEDDYTSADADAYLVPSSLARGGELIKEKACDRAKASCRFPDYPGVVGWKFGFQLQRDFPVGDDGEELTVQCDAMNTCDLIDPDGASVDWNSGTHRRRFDIKRRGLFHYVLYAHLLWKRRSPLPCLVDGKPAPYDAHNGTACKKDNPDFHVPSGTSGISDLPGGNGMVTLGRFDELVGRPFVRASTTFHELGHSLNLWHGGLPTVWGNKAPLSPTGQLLAPTKTIVEPNCKPFPSSMSYLYQMHGMYDGDDNIHLDYSSVKQDDITESTTPGDLALSPTTIYRPAWFAPAGSALATNLGVPAATRYCSGPKWDPNSPPASMARVYTSLSGNAIDWNGDGVVNAALSQQDVNFDGKLSNTLHGFNEWEHLRLDQIGAGRRMDVFRSPSGNYSINVSGDDENAIGDDENAIGDDVNALGDDENAIGDDENAIGDDENAIGDDENAIGDDENAIGDDLEIDVNVARGLGRSAPYALHGRIISEACPALTAPQVFNKLCHARELTWQAPSFGHVFLNLGSRKRGNANSAYPYVPVGTSVTPIFVHDNEPVPSPGEQLPDGEDFTYRFRTEFDDQTTHVFSGFSKSVTIKAVNNAPKANSDGILPNGTPDPTYTTTKNRALKIGTQALGVLGNDTDVDSPASFLRAVVVTGPVNGTLILNANGSLTYTPKNGFVGRDTFTYKANNGTWTTDLPNVPMSGDSPVATVTITVTAR